MIYEDPRTSTPGLGLLLWMQKVYGDKAPEAWQKLAAKTVTVTKGWSEAYGLFLKGEERFGAELYHLPAYHIIAEKKRTTPRQTLLKATTCRSRLPPALQSKQPELAENSSNLWFPLASRTRSRPATGCIRSLGCASSRL